MHFRVRKPFLGHFRWAANALFGDLKTSIQGSGVLFLRRSGALCQGKNGERFPTLADLELKKPKNGLRIREGPEAGP